MNENFDTSITELPPHGRTGFMISETWHFQTPCGLNLLRFNNEGLILQGILSKRGCLNTEGKNYIKAPPAKILFQSADLISTGWYKDAQLFTLKVGANY